MCFGSFFNNCLLWVYQYYWSTMLIQWSTLLKLKKTVSFFPVSYNTSLYCIFVVISVVCVDVNSEISSDCTLNSDIKHALYALGWYAMHTAVSLEPHEILITTDKTEARTRAASVPGECVCIRVTCHRRGVLIGIKYRENVEQGGIAGVIKTFSIFRTQPVSAP